MADRSKRSGERDWTEAEARRVLAACKASGLSMRAFAFREGLLPRRLYWWTKRLGLHRTSRRRNETAMRFVPAVITADAPRPRALVTLRIGAKTAMEIDPSAVSASWVAAVMTELERVGCS